MAYDKKLPLKKASVKSARPVGPKTLPPQASPVAQVAVNKPKKVKGPSPSSGMPAPMGALAL